MYSTYKLFAVIYWCKSMWLLLDKVGYDFMVITSYPLMKITPLRSIVQYFVFLGSVKKS